jgi:hypothetical protein
MWQRKELYCHEYKAFVWGKSNTTLSTTIDILKDGGGCCSDCITTTLAPEWHRGLRHSISVLGVSLQTLGRLQAVS